MYKFHNDHVLKTFNDVKILFTDTDSLVNEIKGGNVYEQCFRDIHLFYFSGYHRLYTLQTENTMLKVGSKMMK